METLASNKMMSSEELHMIANLYDFWTFVGKHSRKILTTPDFHAIQPGDSDWPKRVFDPAHQIDPGSAVFKRIADAMAEQELPKMLALSESVATRYKNSIQEAGFVPQLRQLGMIIHLPAAALPAAPEAISFRLAQSEADAITYAAIASEAFDYRVDPAMLACLLPHTEHIRLFIAYYHGEAAACGLVYFDQHGYAGLHMIGTLPAFRGKGLAAAVTIHLMQAAIDAGKTWCVLHASAAGEKVYTKLGFTPVKEVNTFLLSL
ncbi:GNAT family N-acetyltransferase [Chitinophaga vietnamensis]|uniref:GNAT family N-acetyltransferase n=1 Tax=Chitinophaga vietnamensis TaxID=2593957 RepID=UPI0011777FA8|nr:GNAT family N-acetyltransferase [Chitinophaga vietnamensis]